MKQYKLNLIISSKILEKVSDKGKFDFLAQFPKTSEIAHATEAQICLEDYFTLIIKDKENIDLREVQKEDGRGVNANEIVQFLSAASQAYMKNPTMGGQKDPTPDTKR